MASVTSERLEQRFERILLRRSAMVTMVTAAVLLALFVAGLAFVQYGTAGLIDNDGYYHVKLAYLMRSQGLTPPFQYLPLTILNPQAYYDHHLLYHVYLSLFAWTDPAVDGGLALTQGAKVAAVLMPALAFLAFWWLLRGRNVPYASLWAVGLLVVSEPFLYRMSMPRAQSMALLLLLLGLHWLLNGRYRLLLPLGFVFVWAYNGFPLLMVVAAVYVIATFMTTRRVAWQALVYPAMGILLGLVINPYFPQNLEFIVGHLSPKLGESATRVGNEWSPYRTWTLVENSPFALLAFLGGAFALGWAGQRVERDTLTAFGLAAATGYMLFESRRFVEYFPAFALLFCALAAAPLLRRWAADTRARGLVPLALIAVLVPGLVLTLSDGRELAARSKPSGLYAEASTWLRDNAPAGAMIFQTDWDDFTRLFFYNDRFVYTAGLDPTFMELADPALFETWVDITRGGVEQPGKLIAEQFGGQYVFSDLAHERFIDSAKADPWLIEVYRGHDAVIYQVQRPTP